MRSVAKIRRAAINEFRNEKRTGMETVAWTLYDSLLTVVSTAQTLTFFQNTVGSVTIARTNMQSGGQLPKPKDFLATHMQIKLINLDGAPLFYAGGAAPSVPAANVIFNRMTGAFFVDPSRKYEFHAGHFFDQSNYLNDSGALLGVDSYPESSGVFKEIRFDLPIILGSNRSFNVELTTTTPAAGTGYTAANTAVYVFLKGWLRRNKG